MMATPRKITYASVCDGIGAVHVAWESFGWQCAWVSEIEAFPIAVVERRFGLPNLGDMTKITEADLGKFGAIDLFVGGTPCQSFSIAGLRKGLDDPRGNLALRFLQLVGAIRPRWVLWENVPGVRSSWTGPKPPSDMGVGRRTWRSTEESDFGCFLEALGQLGYGWAYRSLDAQYFHLAQRRERVFVVGCFGDWRRAAAVLFERESLCGHPPPSREAGQSVAHATSPCNGASGRGFARSGESRGQDPVVAHALNAKGGAGRMDYESQTMVVHSLRGEGFDASEDGTGRGTPLVPVAFDTTQITSKANYSTPRPGESCHPLAASAHFPAIAYRTSGNCGAMEQGDRTAALNCNTDQTQQIIVTPIDMRQASRGERFTNNRPGGSNGGAPGTGVGNEGDPSFSLAASHTPAVAFQTCIARNGRGQPKEIADALTSADGGCHADSKPHIAGSFGVRRLTPRECERLQGFPDDYTAIEFRGKPAKDGPRYKALGNSMAVPVMRWIGQRIMQMEAMP